MGLAQFVFSLASDQIFSNLKNDNIFFSTLNSHWLYIGIGIYIIATGVWLWVLSKVDLRFAYPVASLSIIFAPLIKSYYENTYLGPKYWLGLIVIVFGVYLITD
tara:strand:- start:98 stop:409 length:312 start_codon:yes stop_codon:yes gene_type:complete